MIEIVESAEERVEEFVPKFVPLLEAELQSRDAHDRVNCADCGDQVDPKRARLADEGYLCRKCTDS